MKVTAVILGLVLSSTAPTAKTLDGAEFDAYTRGKTLVYQRLGVQYGAEQYLSNRRVVWSFLDGECKEGYWYPQGQEICFVYEDRPEPQCWSFKFGVGRADRVLCRG